MVTSIEFLFGLNQVDIGSYSKVAFADIDGDADADAFISASNGLIYYYQNNGNNNFSEITGLTNPFNGVDVGSYSKLTFADVDQDGDEDAFIGESGGTIKYYQNNGSGGFAAQTGTGNPFNGIDFGSYSDPVFIDLDKDGDLDAFIGISDGTIRYYQNNGSGSFTELIGSGNPFNGLDVGDYASVAFADLDRDGDEDAFIGNGSIGTIAYPENDGKNNFVEILGVNVPFASIDVGTHSTPAFFDLNKDGHLDGFAGNTSGQINYLNNPLSGIDVGSYASPTFVDLDNDGDEDTVVGNRDGGIIYFRNEGNGNFTQLLGAANPFFSVNVGSYAAPTFADVNNDGHLDATIGNSDGTLSYYRNNGNGTFAKLIGANNPFNLVDIGSYSAPVFADLDKDGDQDLFIGESDGTINYYKNNNGTFALTVGSANPFTTVDVGSYSRLSFADLDEDGDLDAFIGNSDGVIKYFENDGKNIFTERLNSSNPFNGLDVGSYSVPSFADLDRDGDKDAFIGNSDGAIYFYENISSVTLNGNTGNNILIGKSGDDLLNGKDGNDRLTGKAGDDTLNGGNGSDRLVESANIDFILSDTKFIGQGTDRLISIETATLTGGEGNNLINASAFTKGSVSLNGAGGDDILYGGSKKDNIKGGADDDILYGNQGNDDLFGGTDKDIFVLQPGKGQDTFRDFENGVDKIGLPRGVRFIDLTVSGSGGNTIISNSNGVLATLTGVSSTLINGLDFVNWSSYS
jgi:hypothetical protein